MHQNEPLPADVRAGLQKVNELLECRSPLEVVCFSVPSEHAACSTLTV